MGCQLYWEQGQDQSEIPSPSQKPKKQKPAKTGASQKPKRGRPPKVQEEIAESKENPDVSNVGDSLNVDEYLEKVPSTLNVSQADMDAMMKSMCLL